MLQLLLLMCCSPAMPWPGRAEAAKAGVALVGQAHTTAASMLGTGRRQGWQLWRSTSTTPRGRTLLKLRGTSEVVVASWAGPAWVQAKPNPGKPLPSLHTGDALAAVQAVAAVDGAHAPAAAAQGGRHEDTLVSSVVGACRHGRALEACLLLLLYAQPWLERPCAAAAQAQRICSRCSSSSDDSVCAQAGGPW